ncbi:MAG: nitrate ABC transporter substrate-binding protein [Planctomycetes bacterium]|nr:nitrate ABC transporter substrate-binding protein [Planctomycetota bacterium]
MIMSAGPAQLETRQLNVGFIPLTDCAALVAAQELGFFERQGLEVKLFREPSWSSIRDKVSVGLLDAAHMLAGMPIAATLGIDGIAQPMITAMSLGLNGNAITVSNALYDRMLDIAPRQATDRTASALALRRVIEADRRAGRKPLTFATVFPVSGHNYQLRYWMASAGIDPDRDVRLVIVPPPQMCDRLAAGLIDGYCVGEPWNEMAVHHRLGHVLVTGYELWNNSPEKVLGVTADWAQRHPRTHIALVTALIEAARWIDEPEHRREVALMLAKPEYVGAPGEVVSMSMTGTFKYHADAPALPVPDFNVFFRYGATFPWRSHAVWFMTQMARWGQIPRATPFDEIARAVYRPDIYRAAAGSLGVACPGRDSKPEGDHDQPYADAEGLALGPDRFMDRRRFDPAHPLAYLDSFDIRHELQTSESL